MDGSQPAGTTRQGFAFGEVVDILTNLYGLNPSKRDTFVGRLQQLQRLGIPPRTNVGRGAKAIYSASQLITLMLCLDVLDCGATPATLAAYFGEAAVDGGVETLFNKNRGDLFPPLKTAADGGLDLYFLFQPGALTYLQVENSTSNEDDNSVLRIEGGLNTLERISQKPSIALNMTRRIGDLRRAVEATAPNRIADFDLPAPTTPKQSA